MKRSPVSAACVVAGLFTALLAGPWVAPGYADAPTAQGWWSSINQGAQPPTPPDVPEDGLLVQGVAGRPVAPGAPTLGGTPAEGASGQAVSALTFAVPAGAVVESLVLKLAGDPPASTTIFACVITAPYQPVQNGEFAKRPPHDCARNSVPTLDPGTGTLVFGRDLTGLAQAGSLSFMLVPGDADRLVLQKPGPAALTLRRSGAGASGAAPFNPGGAPGLQGPTAGDSDAASSGSGFGTAPTPVSSPLGPGTAAIPATPNALPSPALAGPSTASSKPTGRSVMDRSTRTWLLVGLVGVILAFVLGSREGAFGTSPAVPVPIPPQERGIGRFRKMRDTRAVPL